MRLTRREAFAATAAVGVAATLPLSDPAEAAPDHQTDLGPVHDLAARLIGSAAARQISFGHLSAEGEAFRISGRTGKVAIDATDPASAATGLGWYLKHVTNSDIAWDSEQVNLPSRLPAPDSPIQRSAKVTHRVFGNDIWTDYTSPHWTFADWEREIDVLAIQGYNTIFMPVGQEEVAHRLFQEYGYTREEMLAWTPPPCHLAAGMWQGGWTLEDGGVSEAFAQKRVALGKRVINRLRDLGLTPLLPGFVGFVPDGFADRNPTAQINERGFWFSQRMLDWLIPSTDLYQQVAARFYAIQQDLFGASTMYAMNPFTEGGTITLDLKAAGLGVQQALQTAHPGAVWEMHAWSGNPKGDLIAALDPATTLVVDFNSDRYATADRETEWAGTPYAFGGVLNFGGHTTIGGNLGVWNSRFFEWLGKADSAVRGIALSPEGNHGDPVPNEFIGELAWQDGPVDLADWFAGYATRRYGSADTNATTAWQAIAATAYSMPANSWDEAQDSLFNARPSLTVDTAAAWSPTSMRYDKDAFAAALPALLQVDPALRRSSAYRYDLANIARQVLDNNSRVLLPKIKAAYDAGDRGTFGSLSQEWLDEVTLVDRLAGTGSGTLIGPWIAQAAASGSDATESAKFVFDAKQVLTTWGNEALSEGDLHDYCDRSWNGLVAHYQDRWRHYFETLATALADGTAPAAIDWYAFETDWLNDTTTTYATGPSSADVYALAADALGAYRQFN